MRRNILLIVALLLLPFSMWATESAANMIVNKYSITYDILSEGKMKSTERWSYTVLNEAGSKYASFNEWYSPSKKVVSVNGRLLNAKGDEQMSLKRIKDLNDYSATGASLVTDSRIYTHTFNCRSYPYTVEYEVEVSYDGIFSFPSWSPQISQDVAVSRARLEVIVPANYTFGWKALNCDEPKITDTKDKKCYTFELSDLKAHKWEQATPNWQDISPTVLLSPDNFVFHGKRGNMKSWSGFGDFIYSLTEGRRVLPPETVDKVKQLTAGLTTDREKVDALYRYMQSHTRYVGIQLGIGGWQPFPASHVIKTSYGDCKGLSNYMVALLSEAGIASYYTMVYSGNKSRTMYEDFSANVFNHAIVCVPLDQDTVWLECTSQTMAPGYLGSFTSNRQVLVVAPDGKSGLVRTPHYTANDNIRVSKTTATLGKDDIIKAERTSLYAGEEQDFYHSLLHDVTQDEERKKILNKIFDLPNYNIEEYEYRSGVDNTNIPRIEEVLAATLKNYCQTTSNKLFINPNMFDRANSAFQEKNRHYPIVFTMAYTEQDSVKIAMPHGYKPDYLPEALSVSTEFGSYDANYEFKDGELNYYRKLVRYDGEFPPEKYAEIQNFLTEIYKADRRRVVFITQ